MGNTPTSPSDHLRTLLETSQWARLLEIVLVFGAAVLVIWSGVNLVGDGMLARQIVVVAANAAMLLVIWLGLRVRGQTVRHLGLALHFAGWKNLALGFLKSLAVLVFAMAGFILGSIVMVNITGLPEQADLSGYEYLRGNLALFLISLASIYFFSSLGEEVIYRGFLVNRLERIFGGDRKALVFAMLLSSAVFGLAHIGWGVTGMVQTAFMGLALAISYVFFKRNLWILVAAHAYMDTALIVPLFLQQT